MKVDITEPKNTDANEQTAFSTVAASRGSWDPGGPSREVADREEDSGASWSRHADVAVGKRRTLKLALAASRPSVSSSSCEGKMGGGEGGDEDDLMRTA